MKDARAENKKLHQLLDISRRMAVTTDLDALLKTVIEAACKVLECERATIFLYDPARKELYSRAATEGVEIRFPADRGIAGAAVRDRLAINVPDAYADARFNPQIDRETGFRTRNLLTFPLENLDGDLIGVLQALNKKRRPFDADDIELAKVLSAQAGVALQRWFLIEQYTEKQRLARDMQIARNIQLALFPKKPPAVSGYEIAGWNKSADETGGDCYDFSPMGRNRLSVLLADATGHGIGAALVIAQCRALVRALMSVTDDLERIASGVNQLLADDLTGDRFVTAFVGILDAAEHQVRYIAGGQGPLIMVRPDGTFESRTASGIPFAVAEEMRYEPAEPFEFEPGSMLVLVTDGFYETSDADGVLFGEDRLVDFVRRHRERPLNEILDLLYRETLEFSHGGRQQDDLTAVLIRREG